MIKKLLKLLLFLIIVGGGYCVIFTIYRLDDNQIALLYDLRSDNIEKLYDNDLNFIWQGAMPWWYSVSKISSKKIISFTITMPVPGLEGLKDNQFKITVPVKIVYTIDSNNIFDLSKLKNNRESLELLLKEQARGEFIKQLYSVISSRYSKSEVFKNITGIVAKCRDSLRRELSSAGIILDDLTVLGVVQLPDDAVYSEGTNFMSRLREIEHNNQNKLKMLESEIEREKMKKDEYFSTLRTMSEIIKNNPDILKYIYIDKIAGSLKRNNEITNLDYPVLLKKERNQVQKSLPGDKEIDNLR